MSELIDGDTNHYVLFSVGMVSKPVQEPTPEFQIQQEDFPALPGTQSKFIRTVFKFKEKNCVVFILTAQMV